MTARDAEATPRPHASYRSGSSSQTSMREEIRKCVDGFVEFDGWSWRGGCSEEQNSGGGNHIGVEGQCGLQREQPPTKSVTGARGEGGETSVSWEAV